MNRIKKYLILKFKKKPVEVEEIEMVDYYICKKCYRRIDNNEVYFGGGTFCTQCWWTK